MTPTHCWYPDDEVIQNSNIYKMMLQNGFTEYSDFWNWSAQQKEDFWGQTIDNLGIRFKTRYTNLLNLSRGEENAQWLAGSKLNIVDSCFQNDDADTALVYQHEGGELESLSQQELLKLVNRVGNSLIQQGLKAGDRIAVDMPMTLEAVCIYLGAIKAGLAVVTIADSFSDNEIEVRLKITKPKLVFTQDVLQRAGKKLPMYEKVLRANPPKTIVVQTVNAGPVLRAEDMHYHEFLSDNDSLESYPCSPEDDITVLFSSGTTGEPKAIPWNHVTPIKGASDGYYHHDIHKGDVVCWPTNLGWMMGPWLIFATLINKGCLTLYYGAPTGEGFGRFVQDAGVTMLGVVPSLVRHWKATASCEGLNWNAIKCFSSTGEASNPDEMIYLMNLAGNKPVIEYCGGTEIGGGYVTSTVVQTNIPSTFSSQALGGEFVLIDDQDKIGDAGEMFLIPPIPGLSNHLLNRDHHQVYFEDTPSLSGVSLRRHGDELQRLDNGYYRAQGRSDDSMNLGGIKVSSIQIEELINQLEFVKESAAIAISPPEGGPSKLVVYAVCLPQDSSQEEIDKGQVNKLMAVRDRIKKRLNPLFKVEDFVPIEALPRTASGKVMRRELRKNYQKL